MDLNKAMIIGRLTQDPDARTTPTGINVTSFSIATNFVYKNQEGKKVEQVEYHNVVVWRKLAEIAAQYLKRGRKVFIEGRLQTRSWESNEGAKRQRTEIIADNLILLDSPGSTSGAPVASESIQAPAALSTAPTPTPKDEDISVEDIPF